MKNTSKQKSHTQKVKAAVAAVPPVLREEDLWIKLYIDNPYVTVGEFREIERQLINDALCISAGIESLTFTQKILYSLVKGTKENNGLS